MNIPGKLREDLKRIYGNVDPLNCIEDIQVTEGYAGTNLTLTLRVPMSCERYAKSSPMYNVPGCMEYWARERAMVGNWGVDFGVAQKAPDNKAKPSKKQDTIDFAKPERILFSGPKTVVFWPDGSKTMVSLGEGQEHDEYTAFCAAVVKKMFGATHKAKKFLDKVKVIQTKKEKKKNIK